MTPQERLDHLLSDVWQPTDAVITVAEIVAVVGMDPARLVVGTLQAGAAQDPILAASYQAITTVGMSLSRPERQGLIDALATAGQWPDAVRDSVKALGGVNVKEWQRQGMAEEPTLSQLTKEAIVAATRKAIEDVLKPIQQKSTAINGWMDAVDLSAYTEAELQTYVDSLLASEDGNP